MKQESPKHRPSDAGNNLRSSLFICKKYSTSPLASRPVTKNDDQVLPPFFIRQHVYLVQTRFVIFFWTFARNERQVWEWEAESDRNSKQPVCVLLRNWGIDLTLSPQGKKNWPHTLTTARLQQASYSCRHLFIWNILAYGDLGAKCRWLLRKKQNKWTSGHDGWPI